MLIALLLAMQGQMGPPALPAPGAMGPRPDQKTLYEACIAAAQGGEAELAEKFARAWIAENNGGLPGRQCLGVAQVELGRTAEAARTLAEAARLAEVAKSPMVPDLWGQAGNAALLAGDARTARDHLSSAITAAGPHAPKLTAGLLADRARALVELGELAGARADLDRALALVPGDVTALLLSAALAQRQRDIGRAQRDIAAASALAPSDPDVMFEQGNVAAAAGDLSTARAVWQAVIRAAPGSDAAALSRRKLEAAPAN